MIYTVVDDSYDVSVFRSAKTAVAWVANNGLCLDNDIDEPAETSAADIIRLFPIEGGDWRYRIEKHNKVLS